MDSTNEPNAAPVDAVVMPCPRLEFRWERISEDDFGRFNWKCVYSLVLPLGEHDIRSTDVEGNPREKALEIGVTRSSIGHGYSPVRDGKVETPFRDGAHAVWDCEALGGHLPIVAVCCDVATLVDKQPKRTSA